MTSASSAATRLVLGWDRYEVLAPLGSGTAANVLRVRDLRTGVLRAAKVLRPENAANPKILARFEDEFRILRTLHHPHLPEVYDYGWTDDGGRFLIMELVDGVPLDEYFRSNPADIWAILYELCETLTFVHDHKLLHQDIKPSNILVKRTTAFGPDLPLVKLIDFGLIHKRDAGASVELVGTPEYVAPEVVRGESSLTRAVDYYSLGATLFELLTGRAPFVGSPSDVFRAHLEQEAVFEDEVLEWAELYPHVRALLTKDWRARLEAFETLRRAVVSRLTGGIEELDRAYGLARIDSLPMIGKEEVWEEMMSWLGEVRESTRDLPALRVESEPSSGIGFMIDALCAEASITQIPVVRLGAKVDSRRFVRDMRLGNIRGAAVVVCVDCDTADDKEIAFAQYIEALSDTGSAASVGLVSYGQLQSQDSISISERARAIYVPPLTNRNYEQVLDLFRGSTPAEDVRLIAKTLAHANTSGDVVDLLRRVLETRALTFRGGRWAVRRDVPQTVELRSGGDDLNAEAIVASLSATRMRLMACISCADYPVPVHWLAAILNSNEGAVDSDLQALAFRRLVNMSKKGAFSSVSPGSTSLRDAARRAGQNEVRQFHGALAHRLEFEENFDEQPVLRLLCLAAHYEQLGNYRKLAQSHLRAIEMLARGDPGETDREYERGLKWFARLEAKSNYPGAVAIHRFYAKRYLNSLWSRNLHARAHRLLHDEYVSRGAAVPLSFWPKYVRSTLDIDGPPVARRLLRTLDTSGFPAAHELCLLMGLEDALVSFQEGNHKRAFAVIGELKRYKSKLAPRHRHRLKIYEAMCIQSFGERAKAATLLQRELSGALADSSFDEAVLIQAMCASTAIYRGDTAGGLRQVARALRMARKHRLNLRTNLLYRLAAAIYEHMGKYQRAIRAQTRAIQSAYTIGIADLVAIGWQRLAEYNRAIGMFGSAIRYIDRARVLADSGNATHWSQVNRLRYELAVTVGSKDRHELPRRKREWWKRVADVSERGNVELALGQYYQLEGQLVRARSYFASARALSVKAGMPENAAAAAGAEIRTLYDLGWTDQVEDPISFVRRSAQRSSSLNMMGERCVTSIRVSYMSREKKDRLSELVHDAMAIWDDLESAKTRSEIALLLFRKFARCGEREAARYWADLYVGELRRMFANLTDAADADGVGQLVDMKDAMAEIDIFLKRSGQQRNRLTEVSPP